MYGDPAELGQNGQAALSEADSRPAIEVIEMANGETVWSVPSNFDHVTQSLLKALRSIVNGLREEDEDEYADHRASFGSDYSSVTGDANQSTEGVQVFIKEHRRNASKGSQQSHSTRKGKKVGGANRPETKVSG